MPSDHVACHCPRRAAKAYQCRRVRQHRAASLESFKHGFQPCHIGFGQKRFNVRLCLKCLKFGSLAGFKPDFLPHRIRHDENVAEHDGCIESKSANRLQCGFCRELGIVAKFQKSRGGCPDLAIFRQIAAGLAHQPNWRRGKAFTVHCSQKGLGHRIFLMGPFS